MQPPPSTGVELVAPVEGWVYDDLSHGGTETSTAVQEIDPHLLYFQQHFYGQGVCQPHPPCWSSAQSSAALQLRSCPKGAAWRLDVELNGPGLLTIHTARARVQITRIFWEPVMSSALWQFPYGASRLPMVAALPTGQ